MLTGPEEDRNTRQIFGESLFYETRRMDIKYRSVRAPSNRSRAELLYRVCHAQVGDEKLKEGDLKYFSLERLREESKSLKMDLHQ